MSKQACHWIIEAIGIALLCAAGRTSAAQPPIQPVTERSGLTGSGVTELSSNVLTPEEWHQVDRAIKRGLAWLALQQQPDGSFPTLDHGQPGVSGLCALAFAANGHLPGESLHGARIEQAIDFSLSCQKPSGLLALVGPDDPQLSRRVADQVGTAAAYNHAISSLTLSELYGMSKLQQAQRVEAAITKSLSVTLEMQRWAKDRPGDQGGWRYLHDRDDLDSDLSVTGWQLMFLRSARNAGFDVPKQPIDDAVEYIRRCFDPETQTFAYSTWGVGDCSRGMAGAGILAFAHAGYHNSAESRLAGQYLMTVGFAEYNQTPPRLFNTHDRYHYGLFMGCQGMYQLGGDSWAEFFPRVVKTLLANQQPDGAWPADAQMHDGAFGNCYTTALVVLTLSAPNQLLPIFQR